MNRAYQNFDDRNKNREQEDSIVHIIMQRKILMVSIIGALAFLAIIVLLAMVSETAEAGPILQISIENGPTEKEVDPGSSVSWKIGTDPVLCENIGDTASTVNLTIQNLPEYWTGSINPSNDIYLASGGGASRSTLTIGAPSNATHTETGHSITIKMRDEANNIDKYLTVTVTVDQVYGVQFSPDESSKSIDPGFTVIFNMNLTNTGNGEDTINLTYAGERPGWLPGYSVSSIIVPPFSSTQVQFSCWIPPDELKGTYPLSLTATSEHPSAIVTRGINVEVDQTYGVSLEADPANQNILPDESIDYIITVHNQGNANDTFTITTTSVPAGWSLTAPPSLTIQQAGASGNITVNLLSSPDALKNELIVFYVNATTGGPSPITYAQQLTAKVSQVFGINIKGVSLTQSMAPDEYAVYKVNVSNTGNGDDIVNIFVEGIPSDWPAPNYDSSVDLAPDEYSIIEINVTAGTEALHQNYYFTINASSEGDPTEIKYKTATVSVTETHGVSVLVLQATKFSEPEQTVTFSIEVTNEGNGKDDIILDDLDVPSGWVTVFSKKTLKDLEHGNTTIVIYYVTSAEDALVGPNLIRIFGNWSDDFNVSAYDTVNVQIKQVYKVVVNTNDFSNTVVPNSVTKYNLTVRNDGTGEDTFELDYSVDPGQEDVLTWVSLEDPAGKGLESITLARDEKAYVIMKVTIPSVSGGGLKGSYNITLIANSLGNTSISGSKKTITTIVGVYDVIVSATTTKGKAAPGNDVVYEIFIQNTGTEDETYDLEVAGEHTEWVSFDTEFPWVFLAVDETAIVNVTVSIEGTWEEFGYFETDISAVSRGNTSKTSTVTLNTTITQVFEVNLESPDPFIEAEPDQYAYFELWIWNEGTAADDFSIEIPDDEPYKGWVSFPNGTLFTVQAGTYEVVNVTVLVDRDATVGKYNITFTVTSDTEETSNDTEELTVDVQQIYGVKVRANDDDKDGDPDTDIVFKITVWNEGNGDDTFEISVDSDWDTEIEEPTVELGPKGSTTESLTFNITVHIPPNEPVGDNKINVIARSTEDPAEINQTEVLNVGVNPIYEVEITGNPSSATITPGESYNFTLIVENKGTGNDTIIFELEGEKKDWAKIYNGTTEQYEIFVESKHVATMRMEIKVPKDELIISDITFRVNASSEESTAEAIYDTYVFTVDVDQSYKGYMTSTDPSQTTLPGEYVEYSVQVHNDGNGPDSFLMSIENKRSGWIYKFDGQDNPTIGPVTSGSFQTTTLRITPDEEEVQGDYFVFVRATSQGDATVFFNYTITVTVDQKYGVELESFGPSNRDVELEGGSTAFKVKVYNRGNGPDTLSLSIDSEQDYWIEMSHTDVSPGPNDFTLVTIWVNISSRVEWEDKGSPDPIDIDVEVETPGDSSPTVGEGTLDILQLTANIKDIYGLYADVQPSLTQDVEIGSSVTFTFTVHNEGTTGQRYKATSMSYDSTNLSAPTFNPSGTFPSTPSTDDETLQMVVQPKSDAIKGSFDIWVKITVNEDNDVQYHVNVTVNIEALYDVDLRAQNDETNKETLINTNADYTLVIKNLGNTDDRFYISATGDYTNLVTFDQQYVTLGPEKSAFVICHVYADQAVVEAESLYESGIPSTIRVTSDNDTNEFDTVILDTDITVTHALSLSSPDPEKDVEPGETADFTLYVENIGTTSDKYQASVVAFNTSALDNPTFDPPNPFPSGSAVDAGTTTTLTIDVPVLSDPLVPVGEYYMVIRIAIDGFPAIYKEYNFTVVVKQVYLNSLEVEVVDENRKDSDVDEYVNYTLRIRNTGNGRETFGIAATGKYSNLVTLETTEVIINRSNFVDINVQIFTDKDTVDNDDLYGADLTTPIKVTSKNDPDQFNVEVDLYTNINQIFAFHLTASDYEKEAEPSESVSFTLQVENIGTEDDSYSFIVIGIDEGIFEDDPIVDILTVQVNNIGTTTVRITITDEKNKALEGTYPVTIKANSKTDSDVSHEITLNVTIEPSAEVEITPASQTEGGEPGDDVDYSVKIINKGNAPDIFELTLTGTNKEWGKIMNRAGTQEISEVALNETEAVTGGYFTEILVRITIPSTGETKEGDIYSFTLTASSKNTEGVKDTGQVSTTIDRYVDLEIEYSGSGAPIIDFDPNMEDKNPAKFRFKVINNGNVDETSITVNIDGMPGWNSPSIEAIDILEPGKSTTFSLTFNIPSGEDEGSTEMDIYLTSTDGTFDSDPVTVTVNITKPDLIVADVHNLDDLEYLLGKVGDPVTVTATIENIGSVRAESVQVKLYENDVAIQTKTISSINAEESRDVTFRWNVPDEEVDVYVKVVEQDETDDGNNEGEIYTHDLIPVLSFTEERLNFSKTNPDPGEEITIKALIKNDGGNAEDVVIKFQYGTKIYTDTIDIKYDQVGEASISFEVPDKPGKTIEIKAEIDHPGSEGHEEEETKDLKIASEPGVGEVFSGAGLTALVIGLGLGAIIFLIVGLLVGRSMGSKAARRGAPAGLAAFEKEMPEGAEKKALKGPAPPAAAPAAGPAPFERMEEEEEAPSEEEEKPKAGAIARVRCPKCGKVTEVTSTQRPLQIPCECGTTLMLKK